MQKPDEAQDFVAVNRREVGVSMDTLMRMQNSYDIAQTRKREGEIDLVPFETQVA